MAKARGAAVVSLFRGVNVGGHNRMPMDTLRKMYESLGMADVQTYVQSGNVVCRAKDGDTAQLAAQIEKAVEKTFGFRTLCVVRTAAEMQDVVARNPFVGRKDINPASLLVMFLATAPSAGDLEIARGLKGDVEEMHLHAREAFIYYPNGLARPKLPWMTIEKKLKTSGTGRNWNTVIKLAEMSAALD